MGSIELPELGELEGLNSVGLEQNLRELDMIRRRVEAMIAEVVGIAERSGVYGEDGHASVVGWAKATCNWSGGQARAAVQTARLLHAVPEARQAAHAEALGVEQLRLLARVFANPRSQDQFPDSAQLLVEHAGRLWFEGVLDDRQALGGSRRRRWRAPGS